MKTFLRILTISLVVSFAFLSCSDDDGDGADAGAGVSDHRVWRTVFEDDFNSSTVNPQWTLWEGDAYNFFLTDSTLAMDDTDTNQDGPVLVYRGDVTNNRIKVTCRIVTKTKTGEVDFALLIRAADKNNAYVVWIYEDDTLSIDKIDGGDSTTLAMSDLIPMGSDETRTVECEYDHGTITFTVRSESGVVGSVATLDPSPLPEGSIGFIGEIDGSDNEHLELDHFKLEEYAKVTN